MVCNPVGECGPWCKSQLRREDGESDEPSKKLVETVISIVLQTICISMLLCCRYISRVVSIELYLEL